MRPLTDEDLLTRARRREPAALDQLVRSYSRRVYGLLARLTSRRDVAEELMQETFLRMVRTIDTYEHTGRFEPWLFRIAANLARDHMRQRRRRGVMLALDGEERAGGIDQRGSDSYETAPHAGLILLEHKAQLERALLRLRPAEREIIALRHYADLSFREIAETLGVPLGTALARAHRALQKLKALMGPEENA